MKYTPEITFVPKTPENKATWRVIEHHVIPRDPAKGSEDGLLISDGCYAVLDGVSSGDKNIRINDLTPGQFAVRVGIESMKNMHELKDPYEIVDTITHAIQDALEREKAHIGNARPSFVFVAFFPKLNSILRVGDCSYLIDGKGENPGLAVDRAKAVVRRRAIKRLLKKDGTTEDDLRKQEHEKNPPDFRTHAKALTAAWQTFFTNQPDADFGYGVVDGTSIPRSKIEIIPVPQEARSIILASDGYPPEALKNKLEESEEALKELLERDPLGIYTWTATRSPAPGADSFDDRTYVRIETS